jgi:Arc/MetJ-type ribon-helix-helix transcriptional regulator
MTVESERVTIRIPTERIKALQELVDKGQYGTISDAIRAALDKFVEERNTPQYIQRMTIELPKGNVVELQELVHTGDSVSVDDAIRNAVREYVRTRKGPGDEKA